MEIEGAEDGCPFECDPNPMDSCGSFETDNPCRDCGADLNIEECICEKE